MCPLLQWPAAGAAAHHLRGAAAADAVEVASCQSVEGLGTTPKNSGCRHGDSVLARASRSQLRDGVAAGWSNEAEAGLIMMCGLREATGKGARTQGAGTQGAHSFGPGGCGWGTAGDVWGGVGACGRVCERAVPHARESVSRGKEGRLLEGAMTEGLLSCV